MVRFCRRVLHLRGDLCPRPHRPERRGGLFTALLMAADGDMDRAMGMSKGVDYDVDYVQKYNVEHHRLEPNSFGTLYFIRTPNPDRGFIILIIEPYP